MIFRFVDRPIMMFKDALQELDSGKDYLGQWKLDGWLTHVVRDSSHEVLSTWGDRSWACGKDKSLFFLSRRELNKGGPTRIPVRPEIIDQVEALKLPDRSMLAAEWMERRSKDDKLLFDMSEQLWLFDTLFVVDKWQGDEGFESRYKTLVDLTNLTKSLTDQSPVKLLPVIPADFLSVFEKTSVDPVFSWVEGLVLKQKNSRLKGGLRKGENNGLQIKVKWRAGASGREKI